MMARGDYSGFGLTVRQLRKEAGLTLRDVATRLGLDFTYLSKIENHRLAPPSERAIRELADLLGGEADELIRLAGKIPSDLERWLLDEPERIRRVRQMAESARKTVRSDTLAT